MADHPTLADMLAELSRRVDASSPPRLAQNERMPAGAGRTPLPAIRPAPPHHQRKGPAR